MSDKTKTPEELENEIERLKAILKIGNKTEKIRDLESKLSSAKDSIETLEGMVEDYKDLNEDKAKGIEELKSQLCTNCKERINY